MKLKRGYRIATLDRVHVGYNDSKDAFVLNDEYFPRKYETQEDAIRAYEKGIKEYRQKYGGALLLQFGEFTLIEVFEFVEN